MPPIFSPKVLLTSLAVIFIFQNPAEAGAQSPAADDNFRFVLSAVAHVVTDGQPRVIPLAGGMALRSGSRIKFYAEFETGGYFYLFHEDSRGALALLFPPTPGGASVMAHTPVYVPEGAGWIELDANPGRETFHLLVSAERLVRLESLCSKHGTPEGKPAVKRSSRSILAEIRSVGGGGLDRPAEKPLRIAGKLRGTPEAGAVVPPELFESAVEVSAGGSYVKSITIIHK